MRQKIPTPSVPDLARAKGETVEKLSEWFTDYFNESGGSFNYVRGTRVTKAAYKGLHSISSLVRGCDAERTDLGRKLNRELVNCVAPLTFGRDLQVFDLPPRRFAFGHRQSAYRIPFFFVENGVVKIYYIWPRKRLKLSKYEVSMIATIYKRFLLDTEFFGLPADIEFVDASAPIGSKDRMRVHYSLNDVDLWSDAALSDRLTMISQALDAAEKSEKIRPRLRRERPLMTDMPLFD